MIYMLMIYYAINVIFAWVMVGSFYLVFAVVTRVVFPDAEDSQGLYGFGTFITNLYLVCLAVVFMLGLGVKP
eukprot:CAMPEP_0201282048 /NCGR_PEP_ID=MMETSP1317-20130820/4716_1 /ASSEMBLY_ACC=CAM_ASM_000770 /TAXON_ID=187299 /ORGANISM="Undescribed Undescribed, Strain Undescribed" /LENGTH=71 /DNA_ID=CAMNT_0047593697 /DNA_START=176 /DNA_END=391 /DNA_ORIENTATION=+